MNEWVYTMRAFHHRVAAVAGLVKSPPYPREQRAYWNRSERRWNIMPARDVAAMIAVPAREPRSGQR